MGDVRDVIYEQPAGNIGAAAMDRVSTVFIFNFLSVRSNRGVLKKVCLKSASFRWAHSTLVELFIFWMLHQDPLRFYGTKFTAALSTMQPSK